MSLFVLTIYRVILQESYNIIYSNNINLEMFSINKDMGNKYFTRVEILN